MSTCSEQARLQYSDVNPDDLAGTMEYNILQTFFSSTALAFQNGTEQYNTVKFSAVQPSTVQYSTVQYSTVQYSSVQYSRTQYSNRALQ